MDRRLLRYFLAVVEHGGFARAADELGVAQPTLSQAIAGLERGLGVQLFQRLGRGVRLSSAGEALLDPARRIMRDFITAEDSVAHVRGLTGGRLDIAAIPTLVQPLAELIGRFRDRHPAVVVRIPELDAGESVAAAVTTGLCELGLTELAVESTDVVPIKLGQQPFHLVLPPGTDHGRKYPLTGFDGLTFVATPVGTSSRARLDEALSHTRAAGPRIVVETGHRDALIPLVLAGSGAAFLPAPMAIHAERLGAVVVPTTPVISRSYGLIHRKAPLSPAAQALVAESNAIAP